MNPNHISAEEVEFFQENGYLQIPKFYSKREIAELADALDKTVAEKRTRILGGGGETDDVVAAGVELDVDADGGPVGPGAGGVHGEAAGLAVDGELAGTAAGA